MSTRNTQQNARESHFFSHAIGGRPARPRTPARAPGLLEPFARAAQRGARPPNPPFRPPARGASALYCWFDKIIAGYFRSKVRGPPPFPKKPRSKNRAPKISKIISFDLLTKHNSPSNLGPRTILPWILPQLIPAVVPGHFFCYCLRNFDKRVQKLDPWTLDLWLI